MDEKLECFRNCTELMLGLTLYYMQITNTPFKEEKYRYYGQAKKIVERLQIDKGRDMMDIIRKEQKANAKICYSEYLEDFERSANELIQLLNGNVK